MDKQRIELALEKFQKIEEDFVNFATDVCMGAEHMAVDWQKVMERDHPNLLDDIEFIKSCLEAAKDE